MARAVHKAILQGSVLIAEAGTGTGKTRAYLVPALLSGKSIVISTKTKILQEQLIKKDLPEVFNRLGRMISPQNSSHTGKMFPYTALKGFGNYLCRKKFDALWMRYANGLQFETLPPAGQETVTAPAYAWFAACLKKAKEIVTATDRAVSAHASYCDFADIDNKFPNNFLKLIQSNTRECSGCNYKNTNKCFGYCARKKAQQSRVIVINHALFFSWLKITRENPNQKNTPLLPEFDAIIFDEAHKLPADGRGSLARSLSLEALKELREELDRFMLDNPQEVKKEFRNGFQAIQEAFENLHRYLWYHYGHGKNAHYNFRELKFIPEKDSASVQNPKLSRTPLTPVRENNDSVTPDHSAPLISKKNEEFFNQARNVYASILNYTDFLKANLEADEFRMEWMRSRLHDMAEVLKDLMLLNEDAPAPPKPVPSKKDQPKAQLTEGDLCCTGSAEIKQNDFSLTLTPLEISPYFKEFLLNSQKKHRGVVLTSATLSILKHQDGGKNLEANFDIFLNALGICGDPSVPNVRLQYIPSHFDYLNHAAWYISEAFPPATGQGSAGREDLIIRMLKVLIENINGGILILTTSKDAVTNMKAALIKEDALHDLRNPRKGAVRKIFTQIDDSRDDDRLSLSENVAAFRQNGRAILIGTLSLWEGVDIQGRAVSLVIIDKLPFTSPQNLLFKARCEHYEKRYGKSARFNAINLPEAVIQLRQGAGRLIRHEQDCGLLIICDPRMVTHNYGIRFINNLPAMQAYVNDKSGDGNADMQKLLAILDTAWRNTAASSGTPPPAEGT